MDTTLVILEKYTIKSDVMMEKFFCQIPGEILYIGILQQIFRFALGLGEICENLSHSASQIPEERIELLINDIAYTRFPEQVTTIRPG